MAYNWTTEWPGVYARHDSDCQLRNGGECTCARVTYRASARAPDQHSRLISPEFDSALEARDWLRDQRARLTAAVAVAEEGPLVKGVVTDFLTAAEFGEARERSGAEYAPPRLRQLRAGLAYVESELGATPLQAVRRRHVQALIDELHRAGLSSDRIVEVVASFRDLFVYAIQRDLVDFNPIVQLRMPTDDGPFETAATYAAPQAGYANARPPVAPPAMATQPMAAMSDGQPFDGEPTYGPQMHADGAGPESTGAESAGAEPSRGDAGGAGPEQESPFTPPAAGPPPQPPGSPPPSFTPPYSTPMPPYTPPPANSPDWPQPMGSPFVPPTAHPPGYSYDHTTPPPGYPYDQAPLFAPPATRMITPTGAETHYGTPTYGADSVPTQATVQSPRNESQDGVFMSEQMFWWITRIVVIVFVLIAIVLAAESV